MPYQHLPPHMNNSYQPQHMPSQIIPPQHMTPRSQHQQFNPNIRQNFNQPYQQFQNDKGEIFG